MVKDTKTATRAGKKNMFLQQQRSANVTGQKYDSVAMEMMTWSVMRRMKLFQLQPYTHTNSRYRNEKMMKIYSKISKISTIVNSFAK